MYTGTRTVAVSQVVAGGSLADVGRTSGNGRRIREEVLAVYDAILALVVDLYGPDSSGSCYATDQSNNNSSVSEPNRFSDIWLFDRGSSSTLSRL